MQLGTLHQIPGKAIALGIEPAAHRLQPRTAFGRFARRSPMNCRDADPLLQHLLHLAAMRPAEKHRTTQTSVQNNGRHVLDDFRIFRPAVGDQRFDAAGLGRHLARSVQSLM